jgi:tetratricopeptide (TPR) repeat protein
VRALSVWLIFYANYFMSKPRITTHWLNLAMLLGAVAITAGCAAVGDQRSFNDSDQLIKEAQDAFRSGAKIRAQKLLEDATKINPADKTSWISLAQLHFDEGNYAQAVMAGQEVLARDPKDQVARSIVLVSSLRVAAKSLAEMRELNQWTGDARVEAKKVASILREKLGEEVLVPDLNSSSRKEATKAEAEAEGRKAIKTKVKNKPKPKLVAIPPRPLGSLPTAPASPARSPSAGSRSDPFGSLR